MLNVHTLPIAIFLSGTLHVNEHYDANWELEGSQLENVFGCSSPVARGAFSSETSLFLFAEAGVTPVGDRSLVDLFACPLSISNSNICIQKWHNKLTLTSVVKTWRVDISMTSYLLEGRSTASKACLQVPPPFPLPQYLSVPFPCRIIFFFAIRFFFSFFLPNAEPGPRLS